MKIKTTFSKSITIGDIKAVKEYAKAQRAELPELCIQAVGAVEEQLGINFLNNPSEFTAEYYNWYEKPVISFSGEAVDNSVPFGKMGHYVYIFAYKCLDEPGVSYALYRQEH